MSETEHHPPIAGTITVKPKAVFNLVLDAAIHTYGVVAIASRYTGYDVTRRDPMRGLEVTLTPGAGGKTCVAVTIHVLVEYGVRLQSVVHSLQHQIGYAIEHGAGMSVESVHVHVAGMHITPA